VEEGGLFSCYSGLDCVGWESLSWRSTPTSLEKDTDGAVLHSLARKRFPKETCLLLKETWSCVVGLKSGGRKGSKPGVTLACARDCASCWVWDSRDILVDNVY
jgi:hypothetical protein